MKKLNYIIVALFYLCLSQCMPYRNATDGYSSLSENDKKHFTKFNVKNLNTENNYDVARKTYVFEEVETNDIKEIIKQNKFTLMYIWATWCPHCYYNIPECVNLFSELNSKGLNFILTGQYYNVKAATKWFRKAQYRKQSYFLSNVYFGEDENKKQEKVKAELGVKPDGHNGVPAQILFDQKGNVLYSHFGELHDKDTIMYYVNNYNK